MTPVIDQEGHKQERILTWKCGLLVLRRLLNFAFLQHQESVTSASSEVGKYYEVLMFAPNTS
jgi:hypothetical protein